MNLAKIAIISELDSPLITSCTAGVGGRQIAVAALAQHVSRLGYELDVFTHWNDKSLPQVMPWIEGVRIVHIDAGVPENARVDDFANNLPVFTQGVIQFMKQGSVTYESVHAHHWISGATALEIKKQLKIPFAITFHTLGKLREMHHDPGERFPAQRVGIEERLVHEADRLIALCPQDQADLIEHYGADERKTTLIPNGIDTEVFSPVDRAEARRILGFHPTEHVILQICRIVPNKGIENIIRAQAQLAHKYKNPTRLVIVGGEPISKIDPTKTPETDRLKKLARRLRIDHLVTFIGQQPQEKLRYYYAATNIFVTTPWYEPFGITPLEAMACGTPVIGANVGGIKYSVIPDRNGFLVPPEDPQTLAFLLDKMLASPAIRRRLGAGGLRHVRNNFTWEKVAKLTGTLYTTLALKQTGRRTPRRPRITPIAVFESELQQKLLAPKKYPAAPSR